MSAPEISILMPVYNADATLPSAIESIRAQFHPSWELILINDGSTDASAAVADSFARHDPRIRVIHAPHVGIVPALRTASAAAQAPFLARMDADDLAHPARLEKQLDLMRRHPEVALCGTQITTTGGKVAIGRRRYETWINGLTTHEDLVRELFIECPIPHPTFMLRRDAFETVGGYQDHGWAEDYDLVMRLFEAGHRFAKVSEPLLDWRESPTRLSRTDPRYSEETFRALKRHYLFRTYLKDRTFHQWGAGEIGKPWLREWTDPRPIAVVDINPRKIGRRIHNTLVIAPDDLPNDTFTVIAVGTPGARDEIRARLTPRNFKELQHYLFLA